ncbi:unnamed protein product, partial [Musa acuminata subsp. burmannicoides]
MLLSSASDELEHRRHHLVGRGGVHDEPRHVADVVVGAPLVALQQPLQVLPGPGLVPPLLAAPRGGAPRLQPAAPLGRVLRAALDDDDPGGGRAVGQIEEAVEVGAAGEGRIDDDGEAEAELGRGQPPDDRVGEIVEQAGGSDGGAGVGEGVLDGEGAVANVVLVEERAGEGGGDGAGEGGLAGSRVTLHCHDQRRSLLLHFRWHLRGRPRSSSLSRWRGGHH